MNGFRHCLYTVAEKARENLEVAQAKMKTVYDRRAERHQFSPGDQVLALTPVVSSPFQVKFSGLYTAERQASEQNYFISTPKHKKSSRLCHVNLLKPYCSSDLTVVPVSPVHRV